MFKGIDLSSDTATKPCPAMKKAMIEAELGDEQKGEDPTTASLEQLLAEMLGFEKALFFPSATMANEVAICVLCKPGDALIAAENCHLFTSEAGGPAIHAGVITKSIPTQTGIFTGEDLYAAYSWRKGPRYPMPSCVSIENTTNLGGGLAWDMDSLHSVLAAAKALGLKTHLDGARLFNAVTKMEVTAKTLAKDFDTVSVCLSKGLGCPVGAVLVLKEVYYEQALHFKHLLGGAMRQSGILAAAGIYALQHNIARLKEDHSNAELFSKYLKAEIHEIEVEFHPLSTNMVFFKWMGKNLNPSEFHKACIAKGFRFSQMGENRFRAVFHLDVKESDIGFVIAELKNIATMMPQESTAFHQMPDHAAPRLSPKLRSRL